MPATKESKPGPTLRQHFGSKKGLPGHGFAAEFVKEKGNCNMAGLPIRLTAVAQVFSDHCCLVEALEIPALSICAATPKQALAGLSMRVRTWLEKQPLQEIHRCLATSPARLATQTITIPPPRKNPGWKEALQLTFEYVQRQLDETTLAAYIPILGIEVVGASEKQLAERIESHALDALQRAKTSQFLIALLQLQQPVKIGLSELPLTISPPTPKKTAEASQKLNPEKPVLENAANNLCKQALEPAYEVENWVGRLAGVLGGKRPRSVLLVGPSGCGKTAIFHELVRRRQDFHFGRTQFRATSGSRLVAGMSGFGAWQDRVQKLVREAGEQNVILHLGNLVELMEVGKSTHNLQGMASFLRPCLGRGDLLAVAECTPAQLAMIERQDAHLLEVFSILEIPEPDIEKGRLILLACAEAAAAAKKPAIDFAALEILDRLHRRYATHSAYPGRPLRFLGNLLNDPARIATRIAAPQVAAAFARETGLPLFMVDDSVPLDLEFTRQWFAARVMGQTEAVQQVVDLLATVKAQLARPRKPLASFLCIGPTGVGKTELAKTLAEFLFGHASRLVRYDLSEFSDPIAVQRLIGGNLLGEGLLTARLREQPFSVLLLDEFEKADPSLFDLLLQVLGEGRLTDVAGRIADFSNAVIILTSNLGAREFQKGPAGFAAGRDAQTAAREHFESELRKFLRPEFINRLDRVLPFAPLDAPTIQAIARRELELIRGRDGIRLRQLDFQVAEEAWRHLSATGFDPLYGARPLKRVIERQVLAPLAEAINGYSADLALSARIGVHQGRIQVQVHPWMEESGKNLPPQAADSPLAHLALEVTQLRRKAQLLKAGAAVASLESKVEWAELRSSQAEKSAPKERSQPPFEPAERLRSLEAFLAQAEAMEMELSLAILERMELPQDVLAHELKLLRSRWTALLESILWFQYERPDLAVLGIYSEDAALTWMLARQYAALAATSGATLSFEKVLSAPGSRGIHRAGIQNLAGGAETERVIGLLIQISGYLSWPRFAGEHGIHWFKDGPDEKPCFVDAANKDLGGYTPPKGISRHRGLPSAGRCRTYDLARKLIQHNGWYAWTPTQIARIIQEALDQKMEKILELALPDPVPALPDPALTLSDLLPF